MPRTSLTLLVAILGVLAVTSSAAAQEAARTVELRLKDGSKVIGTVESEDAGQLVLTSMTGANLTVSRSQVVSIKPVSGRMVDGEFWIDDALTSKLFVGPTGRSLKRGEGYFGIDMVFLPVMQFGVTDRFSIGAGAPLWGLVGTSYVTPKVQLHNGSKTQIATGVVHFFTPEFFDADGFGYLVTTHGSTDGAVTVGVAGLYGTGASAGPMLLLGGERRMGRRIKLVTENYIFKDGILTTVGSRYLGRTFTTEFGAVMVLGGGATTPPGFFVNFVFHTRARGR